MKKEKFETIIKSWENVPAFLSEEQMRDPVRSISFLADRWALRDARNRLANMFALAFENEGLMEPGEAMMLYIWLNELMDAAHCVGRIMGNEQLIYSYDRG